MRYGMLLVLLGVLLVIVGCDHGNCWWLLVWLGTDFLIVGIAHLRGLHSVFGKRRDGTLPLWSWVLFFPFYVYAGAVWHLNRWISREAAWNEVAPTLVVGRRLQPNEIGGDFENFVDLTSEFQEPAALRRLAAYRSFPILDASAPAPEALREILESLRPGRTFVHCAQGHGRTGLFAAALLLHFKKANSAEEAVQFLRRARPEIELNALQRACLERFAEMLSHETGSKPEGLPHE